MASKEHEEQAPEGGEKKKSGNMLLIIIIAVFVLILVIGGVIIALMSGGSEESGASSHKEAAAHSGENEADAQHGSSSENGGTMESLAEVGIMFPLDLFTVNLLSESGRRYLKVEMNLELEGEELALELETKKPVLRDVIIRILSGKSLEEISTIKGKEALKEEIVHDLNQRVKDGKIKNVYFTDFVVQ
ncbi:MAG TPA: flagellar basal body-associated protein FliL [Sulfuricurvum sp.]|nr:flagellar basal body-associated protein FliL [Sulfuricurvum sp.]